MDALASLNRRVDRSAIRRNELDRNAWELIASDPVVRGDLATNGTAINARLEYAQSLVEIARSLHEDVRAELDARGEPARRAR